MVFLNNFLSLCERNGEAPTKVLVTLGMSKGNFAKFKSGHVPKIPQLQLIADYFGVSIDYLLGTEKAATLSDDGWSARKKELYAAIDSMTEEQVAALLALCEQFKGI